MRIAFSANPLPGHIVPMIPLMRAATAAGHRGAVITGADAAPFVLAEAGHDVEVLPAGPATLASMAAMDRETGVSPATAPRPDVIAEYFAVRRVTETVDEAVRAAQAWRPDVVVSESLDHVGPYVAAALDVPFLRHTFGPERPEPVRTAVAAAAARLADARGSRPADVAAWIDVYPGFLEAPGTVRPGVRFPLRPSAHRSSRTDEPVTAVVDGPRDRPRVLVTMGTVFTNQRVLDGVVASVEREGLEVDLVVTTVNGVRADPGPDASSVRVCNVPFRPLAGLLADVDAVVTVGGAGTVLGALAAGVPLVVVPLGADHAVNAARAEATGAARTVDGPDGVGLTLRTVLGDPVVRAAARGVAARIEGLPSVETVLAEVERLVASTARARV